ncbi:MAG: IS30 family transposase, partial [Erysipelotrichaceae bacterium]
NDRSVFGHWEGDLVTGSSDGQNGAYFTLIERVTRLYIMIPINRKLSKQVYMKINKLYKFYGENFSTIFKSITFDYGNEFSRHADIELRTGTKKKCTFVYFGRPYHPCDCVVMKTVMD